MVKSHFLGMLRTDFTGEYEPLYRKPKFSSMKNIIFNILHQNEI